MGGDNGPEAVLDGAARALASGVAAEFVICGDETALGPLLDARPGLKASARIRHADAVVAMDDKPTQAMRRKDTSMWAAAATVKEGEAAAALSSGNTGALMAVAIRQLKTIDGVDRPAIAALWPTPRGRCVVLDVCANVEAEA